jgi:Zn-dependent protease with chaperone function
MLSRLVLCCLLAVLASACATTPTKRVPLRAATDDERRMVGQAIAPLLTTSGLWRGPSDGCAVALAVRPVPAINLGVAPHRECRFALVVTEGALKTLPPAELRAGLAHEIGHVESGHFATRAQRRAAEQQTRKEIDEKGPTRNPATAIPVIGPLIAIGIVASQGVAEAKADAEYRSYDREEEYAADRYALDLLARLPGDPPACLGLLTLLERLQEQGGTRIRDHPLPAERAKAARERCSGEHR